MLGQVVIDDKGVATAIAEVFAHGATGVGSDILHRRRVRCRGRDHDGVVHRAIVVQRLDDLGHGGTLLADSNVNTGNVTALLIDDRIQRDRSLARLAISDDQLALPSADRDHRVDGFDSGLQGSRTDCRSMTPGASASRGLNIFAWMGPRSSIGRQAHHHAADERLSHGTDMIRPVRRTSSPSLIAA